MDHFLSAFGLRPVRCLTCGKKSYMRLAEKDLTPAEKPRTPMDAPLARVAPVQQESSPRRAA